MADSANPPNNSRPPRKPGPNSGSSGGSSQGRPRTDRPSNSSGRQSGSSERPRTDRPSNSSDRPRSERPAGASDRSRSDRPSDGSSRSYASRDSRDGSRSRTPQSGRTSGDRAYSDRRIEPRNERLWPDLPDSVTGDELDQDIFLGDLRGLTADNARWVARHLVMVGQNIDDNPELAWEHAQAAVRRAGRIAVVRETAGLAAYRAGHFARALTELRADRRMSGSEDNLPVMADCERGLGRPEKALEIAGSPAVARLTKAGRIEMRIVAAGARRDLGQIDAALVTLQCNELSEDDLEWGARLRYAYADTLEALGRTEEAATWFQKASLLDVEYGTDAEERLVALGGEVAPPSIGGFDDEVLFTDLDE